MILRYVKNIAISVLVVGTVCAIDSNATSAPILTLDSTSVTTPTAPVVNLSWAVEMASSDVFWSTGFEASDHSKLNLVYKSENGLGAGGQKFDTKYKYKGTYSLYSPKTVPDKGNWVLYPYTTPSNENHVWFPGKTLTAANGTPISISYRIRNNASSRVRVTGQWEFENRRVDTGATYAASYSKGATSIKVSDASKFFYDQKITLSTSATSTSNIHNIRGINTSTNTIQITPGLSTAVTKGSKIYYKPHTWMFSDAIRNVPSTNDSWKLINVSATINNSSYIDWSKTAKELRMGIISNGETRIDDLKVGYATKVRVYNGATKVYEGYGSSFKDTSVKDVQAPGIVKNLTGTLTKDGGDSTKNKITFKFNAATDADSIYTYTAKAVSKSNVESSSSNTIKANVKTGIKGYSYVIDKSSSTNPDKIVDTTSTTITKSISNTDTSTYYLHIKAIDKAGNAGNTVHYKVEGVNPPELMFDSVDTSNGKSPKVNLSWTTDLHPDNIFWDTSFESSDHANIDFVFDSNNGLGAAGQKFDTSIKYSGNYAYYTPKTNGGNGNWVNSTSSPTSNINHIWFRGKTLTVSNGTPISISYMLKTSDDARIRISGNWQYEHKNISTGIKTTASVVAGTKVIPVSSTSGLNTQTFLTFSSDASNHSYMRQVVSIDSTNKTITLNTGVPNALASNTVLYKKLRIYQFEEDNEYRNTNGNWELVNFYTKVPDNYELDWSQYASALRMNVFSNAPLWVDDLQVGLASEIHVYRNGTKIASGLYGGSYIDSSVKDTAPPNKVEDVSYKVTENTTNSTKKLSISFTRATDNGTSYEYTVKSLNKNKVESNFSNTVIADVNVGISGYSYVIDKNPGTIPDSTVDTSGSSISTTIPMSESGTYYAHIVAIDKAGNIGQVVHVPMEVSDEIGPTVDITFSPTEATNGQVSIKVTATDTNGVSYIELPNGQVVNSSSTTYKVSENGYYSFSAIDKYGNITVETVEIGNIDKGKPVVSFVKNPDLDWNTEDVQVEIEVEDS